MATNGATMASPHQHSARQARREAARDEMFATVSVTRDAVTILESWADLEQNAACSIYQTRAWLLPWLATLGRKAGIRPLFVLARTADGAPAALLCLGLARRGPVTIATWLGGKDANFNMPLIRRGLSCSAEDMKALLLRAARACDGDRPDLFALVNQPEHFAEQDNPLVALSRAKSPSMAYGTALPPQAEDLFADKLSKETRKKLRKKEAKLAAQGAVRHMMASCDDERAAILDRFLALKVARFDALGIASAFDAPEMRDFIESASREGAIELHALTVGARIVAVYGGAAHAGRWSGMFNAFDPDEEIARSSPGDLLLMRIVAAACERGLTAFDLGIGEARYKAALCDEPIALYDVVVPVSARGRIVATAIRLRQRVKGAVKNDPRLFAAAKRLRATGVSIFRRR